MQKRQNLGKSILLCGESNGKKFKRTFTIFKKEGEGASSICYEAGHENSGRGVLKEFYPEDVRGLERNTAGQLIYTDRSDSAEEQFEKSKQEYIAPYIKMLEIRRERESQELASFIPDFEIYYGCDDDCNVIGTVYVWMPRPRLESFDKVCGRIHKHPTILPERNLVTVLSAVKFLTECIRELHLENMLHRDIKPSNFGFIKRRDDILVQTLSLFDINSVCSVYHVPDEVMGREKSIVNAKKI